MASKAAEIYVLLGLKKEGFDKGVKSTKSSLGDLGKDLAKFAAVAGGVAVGVGLAGKALYNIGKRGAIVTQTADSFEYLSKKIGLAPDILEQLQKASKGTISDFKLMSSTATLLAGTSDELGKALGDATPELMNIAKAANKLNPALGTTSFMYESIALGIKRASPMILDNLGLTIKIGVANETMAKKLGKSVDALTAEEKQMALLNATLEAGEKLLAQVGGTTESTTDAFARAETNVQNLKDSLAKGLAPAIANVTGAFADFIMTQVEGADIMKVVNQLTEDGIISDKKALIAVQNWRSGIWDFNQAMEFLNAELDKGIDVHEEHRLSMLHSTGVVIELTGHERALIGTLEEKVVATDNATTATGAANSAQDLLNIALKTYNDRLLFNLAAEHLSAEASFELAVAMGLVDEKTVAAYRSVEYLTKKYDENEDGVVSLEEDSASYAEAIITVGQNINTAGGHMHTATGKAFALRREIELLRDKTITVTTRFEELGRRPRPGGNGGGNGGGDEGGNGGGGTSPSAPREGYGSEFFQHGGSMIVPPGYPNDTYPIFASSGEMVNVFTKGQQNKFSGLSGAMSFGGSNVKPQWQEAIEESGEIFSDDIEESGINFGIDIEEAGETFGIFTNEAGYTFGIDTEKAGITFGIDTKMAGHAFGVDVGYAGNAFGVDVRYAGNYFRDDVRRAGEVFAGALRGILSPPPYQPPPPTPYQPPPYTPPEEFPLGDPNMPLPGFKPPDDIPYGWPDMPPSGFKPPRAPAPIPPPLEEPGYEPYRPPTPIPPPLEPSYPVPDYRPPLPPPIDYDQSRPPPPPPPRTESSFTVNNLNIYTNAPIDTDVPDLLLLRAWASG